MRFSVGQIVKCHRVNDPKDAKLVGAVGEIKELLSSMQQFRIYILAGVDAHYVVYFPAFPEGICHYCDEHHDPLLWTMADNELKPLDDPDAGITQEEDESLPLETVH